MSERNNGYFLFSNKDDGLYITVFNSKVNGIQADLDNAMYYLNLRNISDYNLLLLKSAFEKDNYNKEIKISENKAFSCNEFGDYHVSKDGMSVEVTFYPGFEDSSLLDENEIIRDLKSLNVVNGIKTEIIKTFIKDRVYGKNYLIAEGVPAREGKDGYIEYKFDPELKAVPKVNDDGTVDFHSLDNVNHIKKGDVVAVIHQCDKGDEGMDVFGRKIVPKHVKRVIFHHGKNLKESEDGLSLISEISGHVSLEVDRIFVSNVLELVDVDTSTGDIDYDGDVKISGNVLAGFSVKASGSISVNGIVEGATLIAGADITLNRGIQGMNRANIQAGGNIVTKFIESAENVMAAGSIETDTILHSKVIAKGPIKVSGRNGLIIGGDVKSTVLIEAKVIGNAMGTATAVGVGVDAATKRRVDTLKKELEQLGKNKMQLGQLVTALRKKQDADGFLEPEKIEMQQKTMRNMLLIEQQISKDKAELEACRNQLEEDSNARIKVSRTAFAGTKLMFGEQYMFLKEKYDYCQFMKSGADIKCVAL